MDSHPSLIIEIQCVIQAWLWEGMAQGIPEKQAKKGKGTSLIFSLWVC